jgi:putative colanic acid biosynthesis acetyltransferase WcaF
MSLPVRSRLARLAWNVVYVLLFRPSPVPFHAWRCALLRLFHARVGRGAHPYPRCRIWAPWNLTMGDHSCLAGRVDCYSVAQITLEAHATVSQYAYLCAATHDYDDPAFPLVARPISIGPHAWVAASAFIGPGVTVGEGAVVGARAVVVRDVAPWAVVAGNPARFLKWRRSRINYEHQRPDPDPERREEPAAVS